jgi:hypothetical protein
MESNLEINENRMAQTRKCSKLFGKGKHQGQENEIKIRLLHYLK